MFEARRLLATSAIVAGTAIVLLNPAFAIDLTGAWVSQGGLCKLVFTNKGNTVTFAELSDLYGSGFVIDGDRITGKTVKCTIASRKQNGDNLDLNASCATSIMTQDVSFILTVIDDNNIARVLPEIENMQVKYTRCSF